MQGQLLVGVTVALLALLVHVYIHPMTQGGEPLVQLGSVTTSSIALWLSWRNATWVRVRYDAHDNTQSPHVLQSLLSGSPETLWLEGLAPATTYRLHVELLDETNVVYANDMEASTLPADVSAPFSFAFGSCTMAVPFLYDLVGFGGNLEYIASVLSPAFMLLLGDQVYADVDMYPRDTDALYEATVHDRSYQALTQSTPIFSMYDDHEIYNNWNQGEDDDPLYTERVGLFHRYFGQRNPRPLRDGDHYYAWQAGAASFFMLDVRKYASPKAMVDGPQKTKLGAVQKSHLLSWLLAAETPFKFIVSPMVVSSLGLHSTDEGWALYRAEYHEIFDVVVTHNISGVVVLSGDLHWAGFFQHGAYPFLFEMGASPIAALPVPPFRPRWLVNSPDTLHFSSWTGTHFGLVDVASTRLSMTMYRARFGRPEPVFTRELLWTDTIPVPAR